MSGRLAFLLVQLVAFNLLWSVALAGFRDSALTSYHVLGAACLVFSIVSVGFWRLFGVSILDPIVGTLITVLRITIGPIMLAGTVALCAQLFLF